MSFENEKIIETKSCQKCQVNFDVTDKDLEFYKQVSPVFNGVKYNIPAPEKCPDCRMQARMSFRNERKLYKRNCEATGKEIISMYNPENSLKIYHQDVWLSDSWEGLDYGQDIDHSVSVFEQINNLKKIVPVPAMYAYYGENSDYCNCASYQKNGYLMFASAIGEDSMYCDYSNNTESCVDCLMTSNSQNCYESVDCKNCYGMKSSSNCSDCSSCSYSVDLINCKNCFGCTNLVGKSYCFENQQLTQQEYEEKIKNISDYKIPEREFCKFMSGESNENSIGNYMDNCKNTHHSFDVDNLEDCKYNVWFHDAKNCCDTYSWGQNSENCYECVALGDNCSNIIFCANVFLNSSNVVCSMFCMSVKDCFGCVGLKNKQYCIFNKQYSKDEYEKRVPELIEKMKTDGDWGKPFPLSLSTFPYNSTVAVDNYPISKQKALDSGFSWSDYEMPFPQVEKTILASQLPVSIADIPDDILNWAVTCEITHKPFRIIPQELEFYRKHNLPIPKRHPDQRYTDRVALRTGRKVFERDCDNCLIELQTTYDPDRLEKVYCEVCYNAKMY